MNILKLPFKLKMRQRHYQDLQNIINMFTREMARQDKNISKRLVSVNQELDELYDEITTADEVIQRQKIKIEMQRDMLKLIRGRHNNLIIENNIVTNDLNISNNSYTQDMTLTGTVIINLLPTSPIIFVNILCCICDTYHETVINICNNCPVICKTCFINILSTVGLNISCPYCRSNIMTNPMIKHNVYYNPSI